SIIPGIEIFAPLLTDPNNNASSEENDFLVRLEHASNCSCNDSITSSESLEPWFKYSIHACVVSVKPSGTGKPKRFISAKFAPLPPNKSFIAFLPSSNALIYFVIQKHLNLLMCHTNYY